MDNAWMNDLDERRNLKLNEMKKLIQDTSEQLILVVSQLKVESSVDKPVRGHMTTKETATAGFQKKDSEKQPNTEKCLEAASSNFPQVTQEESCTFFSADKHRQKLEEKQNKTATDLNRRIIDLEWKVQDLIKMQRERESNFKEELRKRENNCKEELQKRRDDANNKNVNDYFHKLNSDLENLKENFEELETRFNRFMFHIYQCRIRDASEKKDVSVDIRLALESRSKPSDSLFSEDLVQSSVDSINYILMKQKKDFKKLQLLEAKVNEVQESVYEALNKLQQKCQNLEVKLTWVENKMESVMCTVSHSGSRHGDRWVGFAAKLSGDWSVKKRKMASVEEGKIVRNFTDIIFDSGGHFDPMSGKFTAPLDGVYVTCFKMQQFNVGKIILQVIKMPCASTSEKNHKSVVLETFTMDDSDRDCQFSVLEMKSGDKLYVKVAAVKNNPLLTDSTVFSCFFIS